MNDIHRQILARAEELRPEISRFLVDLVKTPSYSGKEREVVEVISREMRGQGFDEVRVDAIGNVIGRIGDGPRMVAFDAHIDTVLPGERSLWSFDPYDSNVENGAVRGRGSVDQKGGMASMVYAAKICRELGLGKNFTLLFVGSVMEEDCDGLCWRYLIEEEKLRPELVVITEPTNLNIYRGHRGRMEIQISVTGRSCHGSAPERGDNAVYKISRLALEIERLNERLRSDPFLGKGTVVVSQCASASPSLCAVPDRASLYLDRRLTAGETMDSALAEVRDAAKRADIGEVEIEVPVYKEPAYTGRVFPMQKYYPTWIAPESSPHLAAAADAFRSLWDKEPHVGRWTFSTNGVAIAGIHGVPCIGFGPGNETQAHAPDEACPEEHLKKAAAFYAALIASLESRS